MYGMHHCYNWTGESDILCCRCHFSLLDVFTSQETCNLKWTFQQQIAV